MMILSQTILEILAVLWFTKRSGGIDAVTEFKRNVNSDNARRVLDGRAEVRIIELACGPVPEGHSRWTIRLLEEKSRIILDTPVSLEAIRKA